MFEDSNGSIILVDKPLFWSSFEVVNSFKKNVKPLKIGHAGTLDPMASGLLILCTGKKTKTIEHIQAQEKEYTGTIKFGAITAGYDLESPEEFIYNGAPFLLEDILNASKKFIGEVKQIPPAHSAVKIKGVRSYDLARNGVDQMPTAKLITIYKFELSNFIWPYIDFKVVCSKGTYIRTIAHDLGEILGCGGYLTKLVRTRIGDYLLEKATRELYAQTTAKSRILREKVEMAHPEISF